MRKQRIRIPSGSVPPNRIDEPFASEKLISAGGQVIAGDCLRRGFYSIRLSREVWRRSTFWELAPRLLPGLPWSGISSGERKKRSSQKASVSVPGWLTPSSYGIKRHQR